MLICSTPNFDNLGIANCSLLTSNLSIFLLEDMCNSKNCLYLMYLQPIITQYFIDNKLEIWLLFLIAHSKR